LLYFEQCLSEKNRYDFFRQAFIHSLLELRNYYANYFIDYFNIPFVINSTSLYI